MYSILCGNSMLSCSEGSMLFSQEWSWTGRMWTRSPSDTEIFSCHFLSDSLSTFVSSILVRQGDRDKTQTSTFTIQLLHHHLEDDLDDVAVGSSAR